MELDLHRGQLSQFKCTDTLIPAGQMYRDAIEAEKDKSRVQAVAMVAAVFGETSEANAASRMGGAEVWVKAVEFCLDGKLFRGLLSGCPFAEGDQVEIISTKHVDKNLYEVKAIARPQDRLIALQPECGRGRNAYFRRAKKRVQVVGFVLGAVVGSVVFIAADQLDLIYQLVVFFTASLAGTALWAFIEYRAYIENIRPLVHLTENILSKLGLTNTEDIDLIELSKSTRTGTEPAGYRWNFYRY